MRALVVTWDGGGNVQPFEVLAKAMCDRGDEVTLLSHEAHRERFEFMGASFEAQPVGDKTHEGRQSEAELRQRVVELWFSRSVAAAVHELLATGSYDVALVDSSLLNAATACEAVGTPMVLVHHSLPQALRIARRSRMEAALGPINELRVSLGLATLADAVDLQAHAYAEIAPTFAALDDELPWKVPIHYVGPMQPRRPDVPLAEMPDRFVLVSFSTTWQDQVDVLDRAVRSLSELDEPVVVTTGPSIDPSEITAADNAIVLGDIPHSQLFDRADVVVTHAGHGTTVAALAAGVPLVCMPMGRDQFEVAGRVAAVGAGVTIAAGSPPDVVLDAVYRVRDDRTYRDAARVLATSMLPGCDGALAVIGAAGRTGDGRPK